ncbi:MAG: metalloregulator ArsR/SmtB family transcription factor [bacterium]
MVDARLFQALSDRTRLEILSVLGSGPINVSGIVAQLGCAQPAVSRHLRVLREASLIKGRRLGKQIVYSIEADALAEAARYLGGFALGETGAEPRVPGQPSGPRAAARKPGPRTRAPRRRAAPSGDFGTGEADYEVRHAPSGLDDFLL